MLQFVKIMIYCNKLIDFYINRQESQKVVDNYFDGTKRNNRRTRRKNDKSTVKGRFFRA